MVAATACKLEVVSSWKLDSSSTYSSHSSSNSINAGRPILPPTPTLTPAAFAISPTSVVTVLLPLEPVIATIGACASRQNSSISPTISIPASAAELKDGCASAIPGLATIRSAAISHSSFRPPVWRSTASGNLSRPGGVIRVSITRGVTPRARKKSTQESPVRPRPIMTTFLPW